MIQPDLFGNIPAQEVKPPRPGSRADRMLIPIATETLKEMAADLGVCVRPLAMRRTNSETGLTEVIDIPCGARLEAKCKPCAQRNRRDRLEQFREGWFLTEEPVPAPERPSDDVKGLISTRAHLEFDRHEAMTVRMDGPKDTASERRVAEVAAIDEAIAEIDEELAKCRVKGGLVRDREGKEPISRSTKRRADSAELPRLPVSKDTLGRVYTGRDGKTHRPSTLLTLTLPGRGEVHAIPYTRRGKLKACDCGVLHSKHDPKLGTPIDPDSYDYRAAALDAIHFARVLDRFWQNLRRAVGWNVQYAGAVELQKRLAPHAHFTVRGTMPRKLVDAVAAATYHQVWWPQFGEMLYPVDNPPTWDVELQAYADPKTKQPLKTWEEALLETTSEDAQPACVVKIGRADARGINHGSKDAERSIRYVTKYLTKDLIEHAPTTSEAQKAHAQRLHDALSTLPCSPSCANWLLYGIQPDKAKRGLIPGRCKGKVHQKNTLGFTGRRVLVSRQWTGKTLTDHRADRREWVKTVLKGALAEHEQPAEEVQPRYSFELARPDDPDVPALSVRLLRAIAERQRWRAQLQAAREAPPPVSANEINNGEERGNG